MDNATKETKKPDILYHYRPPTEWALDNFSRQVLYFNAPQKFNDPYDTGTPPNINALSPDDYTKGCTIRNIQGAVPVGNFVKEANLHFKREQIQLRNTSGIACFSENNDDMLMWAHYAEGGRGFCLGFDTSHETAVEDNMDFSKMALRQINYKENLPQGDIRDMWVHGTEKSYADLFAYKAKIWEYEKEWRLFNSYAREIKYDAESLKCVCLGTAVPKGIRELVCAMVINKYPPGVKVFQMRQSKTEFKLRHMLIPLIKSKS